MAISPLISPVLDANSSDTVTPAARKALIGSAVGYAMDGFDLLILGFMLRAIAAGLGIPVAQAASLATATLIGAVLGGLLFGMLSDRLGRVRVLTWTIVIFAVFTGLCALAPGYWSLLAFRTLAGLGLGGEFGIGMALVAEAWPASKRARASSYVGLGWQVGVLAAAIVTPMLLPTIGWRGMFAVGVLPAVAAFFIRRDLDEPALFVSESRAGRRQILGTAAAGGGRTDHAHQPRHGDPLRGAELRLLRRDDLAAELSGHAIPLRPDAVRGVDRGHHPGHGLGIYAFGQLADRIGRRPAFLGYMLGAAVMVVVYSRLTDPTALLIGGAVMGCFVNGMLGGYGALMSELYPTVARATAQNVLFNIGRAIGGFGPLVVGAITVSYGFDTAIALLAMLYVLDMVALWLLIPERRGSALA